MFAMRGRRFVALLSLVGAFFTLVFLLPRTPAHSYIDNVIANHRPSAIGGSSGKKPTYLPEPSWQPPPVRDPFPALSASASYQPPSIPAYNIPKPKLHAAYDVAYPPPLFIGFSRSWPILLQAVVSYITAGWPADQIYVVENTGVQGANARGQLTLQNPYYLDHDQLRRLGVHIIEAPVLMNFAQLQNYYMTFAREHDWPHYFWSHMDVLALSYEDGNEEFPAKAGEEGYRSLYELCLLELQKSKASEERWAHRFFAYDHLTLVNRAAYEDVGGWDSFIPYYMTDCDMHSRLLMRNWTQQDRRAGIVTDVNTALNDLLALYRDTTIEPEFTDPNPAAPALVKRDDGAGSDPNAAAEHPSEPEHLLYFRKLRGKAEHMWHHKHGERGRNTWQAGQHGGQGEPFYYPSRGIADAVDVLTEAGREVYRRKWGHQDCDLLGGGGLQFNDQWLVAKDW